MLEHLPPAEKVPSIIADPVYGYIELAAPSSAGIAPCHAAHLQHASGAQQEGDDATEQRCQEEIEPERDRPLDTKETRACGRQVLKNENQHQDEQQHAQAQCPPRNARTRARHSWTRRRLGCCRGFSAGGGRDVWRLRSRERPLVRRRWHTRRLAHPGIHSTVVTRPARGYAGAIVDRLLGNATVINIKGHSYRMRSYRDDGAGNARAKGGGATVR